MSRPARELLLACAVWNADADETARVRSASRADMDWNEWLWYVRWHRLVPHAELAFARTEVRAPLEVIEALRIGKMAIAARALARSAQLGAVLDALRGAGVEAMPFKGPALSLAAYGDVGVRDSIDLDVVVRPRDVDAARDALIRAGYESRAHMSWAQERMLQRSFGHFSYVRDGEPAAVELHWRFASRRYPWSMPPDEVFARAGRAERAGISMLIPDATDHALLQAMHGTRHQWERLEWLVAFRELMRTTAVDSGALADRARAHGSHRALALALRLSNGLLGGAEPWPAGFGDSSDPVSRCAATVVRTMESDTISMPQPGAFNLQMMDRVTDRVRYIALSVFSPTMREWELVQLPDALLPLYYPIRLLRLLTARLRSLFVRR